MLRLVASVALILCAAGMAAAQTDNSVVAYKDWSVFNPSDPKECYIVAQPVSSEARRGGNSVSVRRGEIRLFVTTRPEQGVSNEISFTGGYPFRGGSTVEIQIGNDKFELNTGTGEGGEWAWPASPDRDTALIAAMKRGANARVTGTSARGTTTIDTFSLLGFTAALDEAAKLCQ